MSLYVLCMSLSDIDLFEFDIKRPVVNETLIGLAEKDKKNALRGLI